LKKIPPIALILLLLASCRLSSDFASIGVSARLLSFPPGYYNHVVFIDGRVTGFAVNRKPPEERISYAYEGDVAMSPFNPEDDPKCVRYSYFQVVSKLPDGRLGLLKECLDDSGPTIFFSTERSIYAYDWHTGELERLVAGELTPASNPKFYTWNPDMTLGIQETNSGWQGTIYWIASDGMTPMDIQIEARGLTLNLKNHLEGKEHTGLIGSPAWSPDGKIIAFFVSTYGVREEPLPKYNVNYDLYFMDPITLKPAVELMDVADAGKIVWSPSGEYLLFRGCVGRKLTCGLWRYMIADKALSLVKEGEFADYIWITDDKIVAARFTDLNYEESQIWEYSLSD
jgi:hypothetical protein